MYIYTCYHLPPPPITRGIKIMELEIHNTTSRERGLYYVLFVRYMATPLRLISHVSYTAVVS